MEQQTRSKIIGYLFRLAAVIMFGISPIMVKYSLGAFNGFAIISIISLMNMTIVIPFFFYKKILKKQRYHSSYYSASFWVSIIGEGMLGVFYYISIHFTSAASAILILSFAPLVALILGAFFWTQKPPYLDNKKDTVTMITVFLIGTVGIFLLVLNGIKYKTELLGNGIALIAMLFDVIGTLALILYVKQENKFEGIDYILHRIVILGLLFLPAALYYLYQATFNQIEIYALLFQAIFPNVLAHYCVYEAYKRLDGFVNYLLFNLSFIITLTLEVVVFELQLSLMLLIGAFFIISSSILAEYINITTSKRRAR